MIPFLVMRVMLVSILAASTDRDRNRSMESIVGMRFTPVSEGSCRNVFAFDRTRALKLQLGA